MGTSAPENGIYGISGLWDLGIMGFVICGILVLWEKEGEEGRNRERRVGQEPWSIKSGADNTGAFLRTAFSLSHAPCTSSVHSFSPILFTFLSFSNGPAIKANH